MLSLCSYATEQDPDLLIYKSDTIFIEKFPLEELMFQDSIIANRLRDTNCIRSACWREHIAIWKIERDSLFLVGLRDCCEYKKIQLNRIFKDRGVVEGKVFADWFTDEINQGFGKLLGFDELNWEEKNEFNIEIKIKKGRVIELKSTKSKDG